MCAWDGIVGLNVQGMEGEETEILVVGFLHQVTQLRGYVPYYFAGH